MGDRYQMPSIAPSAGRALSLLSSKAASWVSPSDLSSRSSDALRELIAENRAAILAKQLFSDRGLQALDDASMAYSHMQQQQQLPGFHFHEPLSHACSSISVRPTLDLMQTANSSYPMVPTRGKSKEEDDECEIWKSLEGTHIV